MIFNHEKHNVYCLFSLQTSNEYKKPSLRAFLLTRVLLLRRNKFLNNFWGDMFFKDGK